MMTDLRKLDAAATQARNCAKYAAQEAVFWHDGKMYAARPDGSVCEKGRAGDYKEVIPASERLLRGQLVEAPKESE